MGTNAKDHIESVEFQKGQIIFQEGDETSYFYVIRQGQVQIFTYGSEGNKIVLSVAKEGRAIGEFAMVAKKPRSATAMALTDVVLVKVSEEGYEKLLSELPSWSLSLIQELVDRLRKADDIIRKYSIQNPEAQIKPL